ncbi:MAG TPA: VWA domain-containing protein [Acidobacteriaceae bacterium]|jgi:VWFA-related protein|nr:VWA domain-containing protein [Acidobacteriaceae bacterium]
MSVLQARIASGARRCSLSAFIACIFCFGAIAQSSGPAESAGQTSDTEATPTITTNVDEVSLDLVVRTKGGKPVLNIQPSDLLVTDNGAPVKLSDLHLVATSAQSDHLVTLVFDHLDYGAAKAARELAAKMLRDFPAQGYDYAVLQYNGRLRVMQSWTHQQEVVLKGIADATNTKSTENLRDLTPAEKDIIATTQEDSLSTDFADRNRARLLLTALTESQRLMEDQHTFPSLSALLALARAQKQITGRKMIIYFSQGIDASADARDTIKDVASQANRAGVTICAIDAQAMNQQMGNAIMAGSAMAGANPGGAMSSAMSLGAQGYGRGESGPPIGQVMDAAQNMTNMEFGGGGADAQSPLVNLAQGTGGIYMRVGGSTKHPLQELHDDLTSYYEATYIPNIKEYNGAFRPIEIRATRKGIVVKSRSGYFALPPENGSGIRPFEVPLLAILEQAKLPTDLAFQTTVLHLGELPDGNSGDIAVQVPLSQVQVHNDVTTHLMSLHLSIVALVKNDKGATVERFSDDIGRHETADALKGVNGEFITMQRHFSAAPGSYTLETAVMDRFGNKAGAQKTSFTISEPGKGPGLSDIALVRAVEPIHADSSSFEPMRYMNGRVIPDLTDELPENTSNLSIFLLVHPLAPTAGEAKITLQIMRNGQAVGTLPLDLGTSQGLGAVPYLGTIGGHVFPPGKYTIEAALTQGGKTAKSHLDFTVEGTIAASLASSDEAFSASTGSVAEANLRAEDSKQTATEATANSKFVIAASKNPVPPPTDAEAKAIIERVREHALAWRESLPNFLCTEITNHSVDEEGDGDWHHKDTLLQTMRFIDQAESRATIELNGQKSNIEESDLTFAHSTGEFGGLFTAVFDPNANAKFTWQEGDMLDGAPVQVFAYRVDVKHSGFDLTGENNQQIPVGFRGLVYLDTATHSIRRITLDADEIPESLKVRATSISVDYNWATINNHDYLMPARGAVSLREGRREAVLNEFEFRNYRRFGAQVRILSTAESKALAKPH